jgi:hypothetical protein
MKSIIKQLDRRLVRYLNGCTDRNSYNTYNSINEYTKDKIWDRMMGRNSEPYLKITEYRYLLDVDCMNLVENRSW